MNIAFRTDSSLEIGTGHVLRCLTLAQALRASGVHCYFICRKKPGDLISLILARGFKVSVLPDVSADVSIKKKSQQELRPAYSAWLGTDLFLDAAQTKEVIGIHPVDWLIVDHYAIDEIWEQILRPLCRKLMVIDDLADRRHDCDLLLDQNLGRSVEHYYPLVSESCTILAGPNYALLRPEFSALREYSLRRRSDPQLKHLLISMGGVDQFDATGNVLVALQDCLLPSEMRVSIVLGPHAPWLKRVKFLAKQMLRPTTVNINVSNMAQIMADSDFAIGAAGSTSWERCCLGLPTLIVVLADNQLSAASALEQSDSVKLLPSSAAIPYALRSTLENTVTEGSMKRLSYNSCKLVDGRGVSRVIAVLNHQHD